MRSIISICLIYGYFLSTSFSSSVKHSLEFKWNNFHPLQNKSMNINVLSFNTEVKLWKVTKQPSKALTLNIFNISKKCTLRISSAISKLAEMCRLLVKITKYQTLFSKSCILTSLQQTKPTKHFLCILIVYDSYQHQALKPCANIS